MKQFLFQTIQFSIYIQFSSIWPIDKTLSGATSPAQSGLGSNNHKSVLNITQSSWIAGASPSIIYCHIQHSRWMSLTFLQRCSRFILKLQPTGPGNRFVNWYWLGKVYVRWQSTRTKRKSEIMFESRLLNKYTLDLLFFKTWYLNFVLSVFIIFTVEFIALYSWNTIKWTKQNLAKLKTEEKKLRKIKTELRKMCPLAFCTNWHISLS